MDNKKKNRPSRKFKKYYVLYEGESKKILKENPLKKNPQKSSGNKDESKKTSK